MTSTDDDLHARSCFAAPCPGACDAGKDDKRVGICGRCGLFVYDLTGLNGQQAGNLALAIEAIATPRFFQRRDGKFLTRNCPIGLEALRDRLRRSAS